MTTTPTEAREQTSVLARLRSLSPKRGLTRSEALLIAEHQATALLDLTDAACEPVPLDVLASLPRIRLSTRIGLPSSGASYWDGDNWCLVANADEHPNRQRFSLAHEYKHVIDHPVRDLLYPGHHQREIAADHFAACLLMPRRLVTRAWCAGTQDPHLLAEMFAVSPSAMTRRLQDLGHLDRQPLVRANCTRGLRTRPGFAMSGHTTRTGVPL